MNDALAPFGASQPISVAPKGAKFYFGGKPMNRPFAYVCSPYAGETKTNVKKACTYCRRLYELGYTPIAPHLLLPQFIDDDIPAERKDGLDMAEELLRRCRVIVVCGKDLSDGMMGEIALAKRLGIVATTIEGVAKVGECMKAESADED